jgi:hypothetical protein
MLVFLKKFGETHLATVLLIMTWDEYGREKRPLLKVMCVDDQKTNVLSRKSFCKNGEFQQHTTNSL